MEKRPTRTHRHIVLRELIVQRWGEERGVVGAEVGVFQGELSGRLLSTTPSVKLLHLVDTWGVNDYLTSRREYAGWDESMWRVAKQKALDQVKDFEGRYVVHHCTSVEASRKLEDESLDFVFIDADHAYQCALEDCQVWWPKLKHGGALFAHDYGKLSHHRGVTPAIDKFAETIGEKVQAHDSKIGSIDKR